MLVHSSDGSDSREMRGDGDGDGPVLMVVCRAYWRVRRSFWYDGPAMIRVKTHGNERQIWRVVVNSCSTLSSIKTLSHDGDGPFFILFTYKTINIGDGAGCADM